MVLLFTLASASLAAASEYKVKVTETPSGKYTASLVHDTEAAKNETVGTYGSKKEARQAGKAAKKAKDSVIATECGNVGQPPCP